MCVDALIIRFVLISCDVYGRGVLKGGCAIFDQNLQVATDLNINLLCTNSIHFVAIHLGIVIATLDKRLYRFVRNK